MDGLVIDNFAGGGGASTGIEWALGRAIDVAINHDPEAVAMHTANHPTTRHYCKNIWQADPEDVVREAGGGPVALAWFSPDCKHFSKAKGGKPVQRNIRDLAWVVVLWAERVKPRVIMLENVEEFRDWGPLTDDGMPCPKGKGKEFKKWVAALRKAGYVVEWRELRACDHGAPTSRKRLFVIARRDGQPIVWPRPTHGAPADPAVLSGDKLPWRTAAECIDWSRPVRSIFDRKKALAPNTLKRVARGTRRYVLDAADPFIVRIDHQTSPNGVDPLGDPLTTITGKARHAVVAPSMMVNTTDHSGAPASDPLRTVTTGNHHYLTAAMLTKYHGLKGAGDVRGQAPAAPIKTLDTSNRFGLIEAKIAAPFVAKTNHTAADDDFFRGRSLREPLQTVTQSSGFSVAAVHLHRQFTKSTGAPLNAPVGTVTAGGSGKTGLVATFLAQHNSERGNGIKAGRPLTAPMATVTSTGSQLQLVAASVLKLKGTCRDGQAVNRPLPTVQAGGRHLGAVTGFLTKYYKEGGQLSGLDEPVHTATAKARMGLTAIDAVPRPGEPAGSREPEPLAEEDRYKAWWTARFVETYAPVDGDGPLGRVPAPRPAFLTTGPYILVDIGMRMLAPRELFRAQGFFDDYVIDPTCERVVRGKIVLAPLTQEAQVRCCGNSVSPYMSYALVTANDTGPGMRCQRSSDDVDFPLLAAE